MEDPDLLNIFLAEARELLSDLDDDLMVLEETPEDADVINRVFRAVHTFKGSSATAGLSHMTHAAHVMENVLSRVRAGSETVTRELISGLLQGVDLFRELVDRAEAGEAGIDGVASYRSTIDRFTGGEPTLPPDGATHRRFRITVTMDHSVDAVDLNPDTFIASLAQLGDLVDVRAQVRGVPSADDRGISRLSTQWQITLRSEQTEADICNAFMFAALECEVKVAEQTRGGDTPPPPPAAVEAAVATPRADNVPGRAKTTSAANTIRVDTSKLDELLNNVGEIAVAVDETLDVLTRETISEDTRAHAIDRLHRANRDLQDGVKRLRLVAVRSTFGRFKRVVRDLSGQLGKQIKLVVTGADTELDKFIVERLADPLKHLVRNSVDHGLESASARIAANKPAEGTVRLHAEQRGDDVVIEVADDGRGIDRAAVMAKARKVGLLAADATPSDEEVHALLFRPGFSTAASVTDVSGRGVGLDAVGEAIRGLGGRIEVETELGRGTTFRVVVPLTLAIVDGMEVRVGEEHFIIPIGSIIEQRRVNAEQLKTVEGRGELVLVRQELLPLVRLHDLLSISGAATDPCQATVVVVETADRRYAALVDAVIGQRHVVLKSLQRNFRRVDGLAGAVILGDGRLSLVLDPSGIGTLACGHQPHQPQDRIPTHGTAAH